MEALQACDFIKNLCFEIQIFIKKDVLLDAGMIVWLLQKINHVTNVYVIQVNDWCKLVVVEVNF